MKAIKLACKAGCRPAPLAAGGTRPGLQICTPSSTEPLTTGSCGEGRPGEASTSLMGANISMEDTGAPAMTVILKIKWCDLVKTDALFLGPLGAARAADAAAH